jgi:hypothetical protein
VLPGNKNSYRKLSEASQAPVHGTGGELLTSLEVLRNLESGFTNFLKDGLWKADAMSFGERFSAESEFTFMEPQGATSKTRSPKMRRLQHTSAVKVLRRGQKKAPDQELGSSVNGKKRTTPKLLTDGFTGAWKPTGTAKEKFEAKQKLSREVLRLMRAGTGMDIESDEEDLSDTELGPGYM